MSLSVPPRPHLLTKRDYYQLAELGPRYELIEGELSMAPAPDRAHQHFAGNLYFLLRKYLEAQPVGVVYQAPFDVELDEVNVYQPDLLLVRNERRSILTQHGAQGAPDLVVEVLSPKTARFDLGAKRQACLRSGTEELWIVDPVKNEVAIYRRSDPQTPVLVLTLGNRLTSPLLPGFEPGVAEVFAGF
jgi:Uma2 family endonuclease